MGIEALFLLCCLCRWLVHGFNSNLFVEQNLLEDTKAPVYHLHYGNLQQKHYLSCCFELLCGYSLMTVVLLLLSVLLNGITIFIL